MLKNSSSLFLLISILMFAACNQPSKSAEEKNIDTSATTVVKNDTTPLPDAAIDRFTMGGESIQKIADSLGIKMFIVTMKPGDSVALHSHPDYAVYILQGGEMAITAQGGIRRIIKLETGKGLVVGPTTHTEKNIGKTTVKLLLTHIYRPRMK